MSELEQAIKVAAEKAETRHLLEDKRRGGHDPQLGFGGVYRAMLASAPVAAQPPSQPVDPVHVINTAIDVMMRRDSVIAGVLFDFMGWLTTRKERLCLSSADDASPAVTAITEFAKMHNLSLDNAMVTDWQSGAAQASGAVAAQPPKLEALRQQKDGAYFERNQVVAALAKCFPSGVSKTAIEGWSEDWHGCVYIDLPTGQVSWHFHNSQAYLFKDLPPYAGAWDGHDTPDKYRRVNALAARASKPLSEDELEDAAPADKVASNAFKIGARWAEQRHGIKDHP